MLVDSRTKADGVRCGIVSLATLRRLAEPVERGQRKPADWPASYFGSNPRFGNPDTKLQRFQNERTLVAVRSVQIAGLGCQTVQSLVGEACENPGRRRRAAAHGDRCRKPPFHVGNSFLSTPGHESRPRAQAFHLTLADATATMGGFRAFDSMPLELTGCSDLEQLRRAAEADPERLLFAKEATIRVRIDKVRKSGANWWGDKFWGVHTVELAHVEADPPGADRWTGPDGNLRVAVPTGVPRDGTVVPGFARHIAQGGDMRVHGKMATYALIHAEGASYAATEAGNEQWRLENKVKVLDGDSWLEWPLIASPGMAGLARSMLKPGELANVVIGSVEGGVAQIVAMNKVPAEHTDIFKKKVEACRDSLLGANVPFSRTANPVAEFEAETFGAPAKRWRLRVEASWFRL